MILTLFLLHLDLCSPRTSSVACNILGNNWVYWKNRHVSDIPFPKYSIKNISDKDSENWSNYCSSSNTIEKVIKMLFHPCPPPQTRTNFDLIFTHRKRIFINLLVPLYNFSVFACSQYLLCQMCLKSQSDHYEVIRKRNQNYIIPPWKI